MDLYVGLGSISGVNVIAMYSPINDRILEHAHWTIYNFDSDLKVFALSQYCIICKLSLQLIRVF